MRDQWDVVDVTHDTPCPGMRSGKHSYVNYGRKGAPVLGCFGCGCTPTDPTPEAVRNTGEVS
jgi:hypothetical protein